MVKNLNKSIKIHLEVKTEKINFLDVNVESRKMLVCYDKGAKIFGLNPDGTFGDAAELTSKPS